MNNSIGDYGPFCDGLASVHDWINQFTADDLARLAQFEQTHFAARGFLIWLNAQEMLNINSPLYNRWLDELITLGVFTEDYLIQLFGSRN